MPALTPPDSLTLGARLRAARTALGLTTHALAKRLGLSPRGVEGFEADTRRPSLPTAQRLAELLGVTAGWLAFGEGPRLPLGAGRVPPGHARSARFALPKVLASAFTRAGFNAELRVTRGGARLGADDRTQAAAIVATWRRRDELAEALVALVLDARATATIAPPGPARRSRRAPR